MARRKKEYRTHRRRRTDNDRAGIGLTSAFRTPKSQMIVLAVVALVIVLLVFWSNSRAKSNPSSALPAEISVSEAYNKYQNSAFVLDVRTQEEWDDFHAPNTTLIPLDQLPPA